MTVLPISFTFIALCASSMIFFGAWIGPLRGKLGILRGDGGDPVLQKRIRIHGNFTEYAPLFALVLVAGEVVGASAMWLWVSVGSFFVGRVIHFIRYDHNDRALGLLLTTAPALGLGIYVLIQLFG